MYLLLIFKTYSYTLLFIALFSAFIINLLPGDAAIKSHNNETYANIISDFPDTHEF